MYIDTHCHINMMVKAVFDRSALLTAAELVATDAIVADAAAAGVQTIVNVGTSVHESRNCIAIAARHANVYATVGIHPCDVSQNWRDDVNQIRDMLARKAEDKIVGIGETGLDFYHKPFDKERQIAAFHEHIQLAIEFDLPLVIHVRESADATLEVLRQYVDEARGVNHCFQQDAAFAQQLCEWGYYFGIDAPITYPKNDALRDAIATIPIERLILETDSPFLSPQNRRGKQNSPAYIHEWAPKLAEIKGVSELDVAAMTTTNARKLFNI